MRKRVSDAVLQELLDNNGCREGSTKPINQTGIARLVLDLIDARAEVESMLFDRAGEKKRAERKSPKLKPIVPEFEGCECGCKGSAWSFGGMHFWIAYGRKGTYVGIGHGWSGSVEIGVFKEWGRAKAKVTELATDHRDKMLKSLGVEV